VPGWRADDASRSAFNAPAIDPEEVITAVRTRRAPMTSASAGFKL
jgi:hypothetical protein